MKTSLISTTLLLAAAPAALAWPFADPTGTVNATTAAQNTGRLLQLDEDAGWEYYRGGQTYANITVSAGGAITSTAVQLPPPTPIAGDSNNFFFLGRGDAGDLDGDGDIDIVYSCQASFGNGFIEDYSPSNSGMRIVVCRNDGNGVFTNIWQTNAPNGPFQAGAPDIKLADMDHDGDLDLVESSAGVRIRWNPGNGVFNASSTTVRAGVAARCPKLQVADFDKNGWPDIAAAVTVDGAAGDRLELYSQDAGAFTATTVFTHPASHLYVESLVADADGDGRMDILASMSVDTGARSLFLYRNNISGLAAPVQIASDATLYDLQMIQVGDVDEDGVPDILYAFYKNELRWRRGLSGGTFAPEGTLIPIPVFGAPSDPHWSVCALEDLDRDGLTDLLFNDGFSRNTGPPNLVSASVTPWGGAALGGTIVLTTGDLNNDGHKDLIASDGANKRIRWYASSSAGLAEQIGVSTGSVAPVGVAAGNWNRDGWTDLAWSTTDGLLRQALSVNGVGLSWNISTAATMTGITALLPADMDGDGDLDILSASTGGTVRIHANDGNATTWLPQNVATGLTGLSRIAVGQRIPGGRPEVAALTMAGANPAKVTTFQHNGSWSLLDSQQGAFTTASSGLIMADVDPATSGWETLYSAGSNEIFYTPATAGTASPLPFSSLSEPAVQIAAVDWDKNGKSDLLVATTHGIRLIYTNANGSALTPIEFFHDPSVTFQALTVVDFNQDGFPDALAADTAGELHLITNTSAPLRVTTQSRGPTGVVAGGTGDAGRMLVSSVTNGQYLAPIVPATARVRFRRSVVSGSTDSPGSQLTAAEVQALVENIYLENGSQRSTPVTPVVAADGTFTMILDAASRQIFSGANGYILRVKLKSTAASAAVQRFYVELSPASGWATLDVSGNSSPGLLRTSGDTDTASGLFYVRPVGLLDTWRLANFGSYDITSVSANDADPDHDGLPNLMEYVMSRDPKAGGGIGSNLAIELINNGWESPFQADLRLLTAYDSRVKLTIQKTTGLQTWTTLSTRTGTGAWTVTVPSSSALGGGRTRFVFNTSASPDTTPKFYVRLKAEELP